MLQEHHLPTNGLGPDGRIAASHCQRLQGLLDCISRVEEMGAASARSLQPQWSGN